MSRTASRVGRDPGQDRQGIGPRIRDERRAEQDDEQAEHGRPDVTRGDGQDGAADRRPRRSRPGPGSRRAPPVATAHGARVASSGCVGVWMISKVLIGQ